MVAPWTGMGRPGLSAPSFCFNYTQKFGLNCFRTYKVFVHGNLALLEREQTGPFVYPELKDTQKRLKEVREGGPDR